MKLYKLLVVFIMICAIACAKEINSECITVNAQHYTGDAIVIKNEGCLTIEIESQLSTGYRWHFTIKENPNILINSDYKVKTMEENTVGGVDKEIFTFKAVKPGKAIIVFNYMRPFDKRQKIVKTKEFNVTVTE